MSFAATLALIAGYERGAINAGGAVGRQRDRWSNDCVLARGPGDDAVRSVPLPPRHAPYGVLANLLAMPIVSAWVMPMGFSASFDGTEAALRWNFKQIAGTPKRTNGTLGPKLDPRAYCRAPFDIAAMTSAAESSALRVRLA